MVLAFLEKANSGGTAAAAPAAALTAFISGKMGRDDVRLLSCRRLEGGAVQENWRLEIAFGEGAQDERLALVLRTDARTALPDSRPKAEEFALLKVAFDSGVRVPEPLWLCGDEAVIGAPFLMTREVAGTARGRAITALNEPGGGNPKLAGSLATELARIHSIKSLPAGLAFLQGDDRPPAVAEVAQWRHELSALPGHWPALEWGLRWCENHLPPPPAQPCLVHGDFRSGNYLVDVESGQLTAILDWEFASWGDPLSDLGWFCAACWRFDRPDLEAGGIAPRTLFYRAYEAASGLRPDPGAVYFWEVLAHIRWAIIAVQQGLRFFKGGETCLDLALTGRLRPAQIQKSLLEMTGPAQWRTRGADYARDGRRPCRQHEVNIMTDLTATRQILASAAALYRDELQPALPGSQQENARMLEQALSAVLADLDTSADRNLQNERDRREALANEIRRGSEDGKEPVHLTLLQAIAQEIGS